MDSHVRCSTSLNSLSQNTLEISEGTFIHFPDLIVSHICLTFGWFCAVAYCVEIQHLFRCLGLESKSSLWRVSSNLNTRFCSNGESCRENEVVHRLGLSGRPMTCYKNRSVPNLMRRVVPSKPTHRVEICLVYLLSPAPRQQRDSAGGHDNFCRSFSHPVLIQRENVQSRCPAR